MQVKTKNAKFVALLSVVLLAAAALATKALWPTPEEGADPPPLTNPDAAIRAQPAALSAQPRRTAELQEQTTDPCQDPEYVRIVTSCRHILEQYPGTPQAEMAKQLLRRTEQRYGQDQAQPASSTKPEIRRSRPLRRRANRRGTMDADVRELADQP